MRILLVSMAPVKKEISSGNTFLNLFDGMDNIELAAICTRNGFPDAPIKRCFCTTEAMQINNALFGDAAGKIVEPVASDRDSRLIDSNNKMDKFARRHRWTIFFWMQNLVWKLGRWKSTELEQFIREYEPDIIFTVFTNPVFFNNLIQYALSVSKSKLVLYAWDNNYSAKRLMLSPLRWIKHFIDRASMRDVARLADQFYVISEIQKKDYEKCFHKECKVLTKGADFLTLPDLKESYSHPLQLVFTGNIGLNRWKSLQLIADALEEINSEEVKAQLRIYTANQLTERMSKALNRRHSSFVMGSVPANEVAKIQRDADILVHVEAMDLKNRLAVRQSFSTKIVDYLKSARPILAVGPKDVASIDHLIRNDCAIVADSKEELVEKLNAIVMDKSALEETARRGYECGRKYHNKQDIQQMLRADLEKICGQ